MTISAEGLDQNYSLVSPAFVVMAVVTALMAAVVIPGHPPGMGIVIVVTLLTCAVIIETRGQLQLPDLALAGAALLLVLNFGLRTAPWLLILDLAGAVMIGGIAASRAERWVEFAAAVVRPLGFIPRGVALLLRPAATVASRNAGAFRPIARGSVAGIILIAVFGALFLSADKAFAQLAHDVAIPSWNVTLLPTRVATAAVILGVAGAFVLVARAAPVFADDSEAEREGKWQKAEWVPPLVLVNVLFAAFVAVQFAVLFGGNDYVLRTSGLTYAQYARAGFFQLLVVAGLTLALVAIVARWAIQRDRAERVLLKALLGLLCVLTLVVLLSAFKRLLLYEDAFGLTRLRLMVHTTIVWLALIFVLVIAAGLLSRSKWLPRGTVYASVAVLIALNVLNPDGLIARRNIERYQRSGLIDSNYLSSLSEDAIPELVKLQEPLRSCALQPIAIRLSDDRSVWSFNIGRDRAIETLNQLSVSPGGPEECP